MSRFRFRMQSLILLIQVPVLLISTIVIGILVYRNLYRTVLESFDQKLYGVATATSAFIDGDVHQAILKKNDEKSAQYLGYVLPMRRIMVRDHLTYLYSQIVGPTSDPTKNITYVLDATVGANHSDIGALDSLPDAEEAHAEKVQQQGTVYISDIQPWQIWGLIKSAFIPIFNSKGAVVAMAGADVDVTIILKKSRQALADVGLVAVICLLIGIPVSVYAARRLTKPIENVKDAALQVAAGRYGHRITVVEPRELSHLAESFNDLSNTLAVTIDELTQANTNLEDRRRLEELRHALINLGDAEAGVLQDNLAIEWVGSPDARDASGFVASLNGRQALVWISEPQPTAMAAASLRADVAMLCKRLLDRYGDDMDALAEHVTPLFASSIAAFIMFDRAASAIRFVTRRPLPVSIAGGGTSRLVDVAGNTRLQIGPGEVAVVTSGDGPPASPADTVLPPLGRALTRLLDVANARPFRGLVAAIAGHNLDSDREAVAPA